MQIMKFKNVDELLKRAHDTQYGLAGAVFTKDVEKAIYISNSLRAGTVWLVLPFTFKIIIIIIIVINL